MQLDGRKMFKTAIAGKVLLIAQPYGSLNAAKRPQTLRMRWLIPNHLLSPATMAKQQLGFIASQDSLAPVVKATGIARNVGAHYVLYQRLATLTPDLQNAAADAGCRDGEIIWSGTKAVSAIPTR